ncbi:IucA/IucC family C-terminal-domain containing protein [Paenibacillus lautus]|uniref:IucA/IucC family C-terminal-domain containing protein n=1 Tax=Paenibacillus lautus TaxID=1401 RepID=UPI001C7CA9BA|nr:IucA/IucC family C-terminal-domain containing protein [Paenibacillus lautus]MBX4149100.1 (2Fe-2S)-binding protein [Paenibacillus lautus]
MNHPVPLSEEELEVLTQKYGLNEAASSFSEYESASGVGIGGLVPLSALLEPGSCAAYLDGLAVRIGTDSRPIAASMFAKRYAAVAVVPYLHALTCYDKALELVFESMLLRSGKHWLEGITVDRPLRAVPRAEWREAWRSHVAERWIRCHLTSLWQALSSCSGLPAAILWENTAVRIYSLYEKKLPATGAVAASRIEDDFRYLLHGLPAEAFKQRRQPFARFYGGGAAIEEARNLGCRGSRPRLTCCLYYRVSREGDYCDACPKHVR